MISQSLTTVGPETEWFSVTGSETKASGENFIEKLIR
jgi:hypothetical protein